MPFFQKLINSTNKEQVTEERVRSDIVVYSIIFSNISLVDVKISLFLDKSGSGFGDETSLFKNISLPKNEYFVFKEELPVSNTSAIGTSVDTAGAVVVTTMYRNDSI